MTWANIMKYSRTAFLKNIVAASDYWRNKEGDQKLMTLGINKVNT